MDTEAEEISLRRLAANFISKSEYNGLCEIDTATRITYDIIRKIHNIILYLSYATLYSVFITLLLFIQSIIYKPAPLNYGLASISLILIYFLLCIIWYYIFLRVKNNGINSLIYKKCASEKTIKNLELFFKAISNEAIRVYFLDSKSRKHYIDRKIFSGKLRLLILAEDGYMRKPTTPLYDLRSDHTLYVTANVDALIKQSKAKPNPGGRPAKYDYLSIVESLLGDPVLAQIDPTKTGSIADIMGIIRNRNDEALPPSERTELPQETMLREHARKICSKIRENRKYQK